MKETRAVPYAAAALLLLSACADRTVSGPAPFASQVSFAANANAGLTLHPDGFGRDSYAAWRSHEGLQDSNGNAYQALYFQKMTATEAFAAGVARINGLEGQAVSTLTGLEWQHRDDGWCGAGAPRWNLYLQDNAGTRYTVFLGCAAAAHSTGDATGWTRDTYGLTALGAALPIGVDPATLTIRGLYILFDEGTTLYGAPYGLGFVFLDNIKVNTKTWTSPADNGSN